MGRDVRQTFCHANAAYGSMYLAADERVSGLCPCPGGQLCHAIGGISELRSARNRQKSCLTKPWAMILEGWRGCVEGGRRIWDMGNRKGQGLLKVRHDFISSDSRSSATAEALFHEANQAYPRPWSYFMATWAAVHDTATHPHYHRLSVTVLTEGICHKKALYLLSFLLSI